MTLTTSMVIGLIIVLITFAIVAVLEGAIVLLEDHPLGLAIRGLFLGLKRDAQKNLLFRFA